MRQRGAIRVTQGEAIALIARATTEELQARRVQFRNKFRVDVVRLIDRELAIRNVPIDEMAPGKRIAF